VASLAPPVAALRGLSAGSLVEVAVTDPRMEARASKAGLAVARPLVASPACPSRAEMVALGITPQTPGLGTGSCLVAAAGALAITAVAVTVALVASVSGHGEEADMQFAIVESGYVNNVVVANEALADNWVRSATACIGDQYVDGQFVRPAPVQAPVPQSVTMRQCRIALLDAGLLDAVKSSIATMPGTDGERARIDWEYAQEVRRDWPLIGYMAGDLGLTDEQVDGLFMAAAAI